MLPFSIANDRGRVDLVLTCEHASCAVPSEYDDLGLAGEDLEEHIGWDIGAGALTRSLAERLNAPAVLAGVSRLLIDCNRDLSDHDLIPPVSHGVHVPGNQQLDAVERQRRIENFYEPYHAAIDAIVSRRPQAFLLSLHSFTPELNGNPRRFDVGVLFDVFSDDARLVGEALAGQGLAVRYNQPYSGLDGLIFSARTHGMRHGLRYLELEINNRLLRDPHGVTRIADAVTVAVTCWLEG